MTHQIDTSASMQPRRPFAAKYQHRGWGLGLTIFGGLGALVGIVMVVAPTPATSSTGSSSNPIGVLVVYLALLSVGIYLLRGRGVNPKKAAAIAQAAQRQAALAAQGVDQAMRALASARGAAAVVAYRNLEATIKRFHPQDAYSRLRWALESVHFDASKLTSPPLGTVYSIQGGAVEVFRDWIIYGQEAHDVDASTRGSVYLDGAVQVATVAVQAGSRKVVSQAHDMRTAHLQFVSASWSLSVPIHPDRASDARRLVEQLAANVELLKPKGVTAADIRSMVDRILSSTGQPPAEKLKQLSNLRFERLLSDEEFEAAKARILGI